MRIFLLSMAGAFCSLILFIILVIAMLAGTANAVMESGLGPIKPEKIPDGDMVLTVDLRRPYPDKGQSFPLSFLSAPGFVDILTRLDDARRDPDVKGVVLRVGNIGLGYARSEEIRAAILALKESGKFVFAHAQGLGPGLSDYRAIAAADKVAMQPGAEFMVSGSGIEMWFMKDALEKLGLVGEFEAIGTYKSGPNTWLRDDFSPAQREELHSVLDSLFEQSATDIATDRNIEMEALIGHFESTPFAAADAVSLGLVDALTWPEDLLKEALDRADGAEIVPIMAYMPEMGREHEKMPETENVIALISGEGAIISGGDNGGSGNISSDLMADSILRAGEDEEVQALVIRLDSPGGSPGASEQIRHAITKVQDQGKPVVISMGPLAASGGYWIALSGDFLMASRTSITGSIGVYGGKIAIADGLRRLGIEPRRIERGGPMISMGSSESFTPAQRQRLRQMLERIYDRFVTLLAEERGLSDAQIAAAAGGRIWTGSQAMELDLIDGTGGLIDAVAKAAELAGIEPDEVSLRTYEARPEIFELLSGLLRFASSMTRIVGMLDMGMNIPSWSGAAVYAQGAALETD